MKRYEEILNKEIENNAIKVIGWSKSASGRAWYKGRKVRIPKPTNLTNLIIGLHEIGHIVTNYKSDPVWKDEYLATKYSEDKAKEHGIELPYEVLEDNRNYLLRKLVGGLLRRLNIDNVDQEVIEFLQIDRDKWRERLQDDQRPYIYTNNRKKWNDCKVLWTKRTYYLNNNSVDQKTFNEACKGWIFDKYDIMSLNQGAHFSLGNGNTIYIATNKIAEEEINYQF